MTPNFEAEFRLRLRELGRQWASRPLKSSTLFGTGCGQPAGGNFLPDLETAPTPSRGTSTSPIIEHALPLPIRLQNSLVSMLPSRSR